MTDAAAVVAVRRAAEDGVPLPSAIAAARTRRARSANQESLAAAAEYLPAPLMLVSGPEPLSIAYVNPALAAAAQALRAGDGLLEAADWFAGSECDRALRRVFRGEQTLECAHPAWSSPGEQVRSLVYRVPAERGRSPLVALVQLERPRERETKRALARARADRDRSDARLKRHTQRLSAIAEVADLFQAESGPSLLQTTAETLVKRLSAIDGGIAIYMGGELALGSSTRGLLGPRMVPIAAHAELASALRRGTPQWLTPVAAGAFGTPEELAVLLVPVTVLADTLGALLLVTEEPFELDQESRQLWSVVSASIGFALLRDRLVEAAQNRS